MSLVGPDPYFLSAAAPPGPAQEALCPCRPGLLLQPPGCLLRKCFACRKDYLYLLSVHSHPIFIFLSFPFFMSHKLFLTTETVNWM